MITTSQEAEERAVWHIADLMCAAARTAPKARGTDNLVTILVSGKEKDKLSEKLRHIAKDHAVAFVERDANCIDKAPVVVLLGQKAKPLGVRPCGFCGYSDCGECAKGTGVCAISTGDLGIAIGSAVNTAALHHADNRVMFSVGKAALAMELFPADVNIAYGIPLSITGKNPFFDR